METGVQKKQIKAQERDRDPQRNIRQRKMKWVWFWRKKRELKSRKWSRHLLMRRKKSYKESAKRRRKKRLRKKINLLGLPRPPQWISLCEQRGPLWLSMPPLQIPVAAVVKKRKLLRNQLPKPPHLPLHPPANRRKQNSVLPHLPHQKPHLMKPLVIHIHHKNNLLPLQPKIQEEMMSQLLSWPLLSSRPAAVHRNGLRARWNSHQNLVPLAAKRRSSL